MSEQKNKFSAVVDGGSNSICLSIYDNSETSDGERNPNRVGHAIRVTCKLAQGMNGISGFAIRPRNRQRALQTTRLFKRILRGEVIGTLTLRQLGITGEDAENVAEITAKIRHEIEKHGPISRIHAAGTEAFRRVLGTKPGDKFIGQFSRMLGHALQVISGTWEAMFQGLAVLARGYGTQGLGVGGAEGGGSTQFWTEENGVISNPLSIPKGTLTFKDTEEIAAFFKKETAGLMDALGGRKVDTFKALGSEWRWVARLLVYRIERAQAEKTALENAPKKADEKKKAALVKAALDKISVGNVKIHKDKDKNFVLLDYAKVKNELLALSKEAPAYFRQATMPEEVRGRAEHLALGARTLYEVLAIVQPKNIMVPSASFRDGIASTAQKNSDFSLLWANGAFAPRAAP